MNTRHYKVTAKSVPIWFNKYGDHDHDGMMYILTEQDGFSTHHNEIINYILDLQKVKNRVELANLMAIRNNLISLTSFTDPNLIEQWFPDTVKKSKLPHPLIVPLVLRAAKDEVIEIEFKNELEENRLVGMHLVGPGADIESDGSDIWGNPSTLISKNQTINYKWECNHEGVYVIHDAGDFRGDEAGTNAHGLFGALVVEPAGSRWRDPENGHILSSGLYADVIQYTDEELSTLEKAPYPIRDNITAPNSAALSNTYPVPKASFREYVIFIHDEPHWVPPHATLQPNPCEPHATQEELSHAHTAGSLMPISYRAEPMISRERELWKRMKLNYNDPDNPGINPDNIVVNEEQHHSCWMFGEPSTPVLRAYLGDPVRIRLVHAGVKETHVFHLHVYEWHATAFNPSSNILDAITISPQTGHTIVPLYGAGNRQMVPGDVIWHCHLYPHFHHGMWGMFRTFDRLQNGEHGQYFNGDTGEVISEINFNALNKKDKNKFGRRLGFYPNLEPINKLVPLPDREAPPAQDLPNKKLGFPHFIQGEVCQKSPIPPWHKPQALAEADGWVVNDYDYHNPTVLELNAFNIDPKPGELFTAFPHNDSTHSVHSNESNQERLPPSATIKHDIDVLMTPIKYNDHGWWDPHGHLYALAGHDIPTFSEVVHEGLHMAVHHVMEANPTLTREQAKEIAIQHAINITPQAHDPFFFRCNKTNVLELTLTNKLEHKIPGTPFDSAWPKGSDKMVINQETGVAEPCTAFANSKFECGLHVHIVKFDPIACDGASTGWNYMSAPAVGKK